MKMDRNINWHQDSAINIAAEQQGVASDENPLAFRKSKPSPSGGRKKPDVSRVAQKDKWFEQLLKYIPAEAISLYIALDGVPRSVQMTDTERRWWYFFAISVAVTFTYIYLLKVWNIKRISQIGLSVFALLVYVYAQGGFVSTFDFYKPWQGTILLVITAAFLAFVPPPDLVKDRK